jgi:hypothetical protein
MQKDILNSKGDLMDVLKVKGVLVDPECPECECSGVLNMNF